MNEPQDSLELTPEPVAVQQATQWLEALAARDNWHPRLQFGLTLSVDEALTNVVNYAFAGRAGDAARPFVRLQHHAAGQTVQICIIDNGVAFDPTRIPPPALDESVETATIGGHGVQLMRHYLKSLSYVREADENRLTLTAAHPPADAS